MPRFLGLCLLLLASCSRGYDSPLLGVKWQPPAGFELGREASGPPRVAEFGSGLRLLRTDGALPTEGTPEVLAQAARSAAGLPPAEVLDCRTGTLPAGAVVRCELRQGSDRELLYLVPQKVGAVLVDLVAPEARFGPLSAKVEGSLSTLRVH
jgi:hypothetical protein